MTDSFPRSRNKDATRAVILAAAQDVLAESGFQGFGINAIARQAGCDKQLIYRYFGGLDGLLEAIGEALADWIGSALPAGAPAKSYGELMQRLALGYLTALRGNPLVQKIIAWELSAPSEQLAPLTAARSRGMMRWMMAIRGDLLPPAGIDAPVVNAILIGAVQQLVLASTADGKFMGLALVTDDDWARVETSLTDLLSRLYPV